MNFRTAAAQRASALGLTGRVWNREDGEVELVAEGQSDALNALERWLGHGPGLARVSGVQREALSGEAAFSDFQITNEGPSAPSDPRA